MPERRFGRAKPPVEAATFEFFDLTVRFNPEFGQLGLIDFLESASTIDTEDPSAMVVVKDALRQCVHGDDFDGFWRVARRERQDVEDLMEILYAAVEVATDRPTGRQSDSPGGLPSTNGNSAGDSSSPVIDRLIQRGRLDLALIVDQAAGSRASA